MITGARTMPSVNIISSQYPNIPIKTKNKANIIPFDEELNEGNVGVMFLNEGGPAMAVAPGK